MQYKELAEFYARLEGTTKRLEMTDILTEMLKAADPQEIKQVIYLTQGKLHPDWKNEPELGLAERTAIQAIAQAVGIEPDKVQKKLNKIGDIGIVAEELVKNKTQLTIFEQEPLSVLDVYEKLNKIAKTTGEGSNKKKIKILAGLISDASPLEARYILRTVTGELRLGIADMTILDALALAFTGNKENREFLERAYNLTSDLGEVAEIIATKGLEEIKKIKIKVGRPIRMMAAQRLPNAKEILAKMGGKCFAEYKYDGERIQAHKDVDMIILYSRRQEQISDQYPDVCEYIRKYVKPEQAIIEGECVAIDISTGKMKPFQELMQRKRKYDISEKVKELPVKLFVFDVLYVDGEDYTTKPFMERRKKLGTIISESPNITLTTGKEINTPEALLDFFEDAISEGCEGIMAKNMSEDSIYQAGARSWLWVKLKKSYQEGLTDSVDLVIVGAFYGRGKRAGVYGTILAAAYDPLTDTFPTVCKLGSGFTEDDLDTLKQRLEPIALEHKHPRVISEIEAEVWFQPKYVIEVLGDEITLSPIHTCCKGKISKDAGLAIRFPRFISWRDDKSPEEATTPNELMDMYMQFLESKG